MKTFVVSLLLGVSVLLADGVNSQDPDDAGPNMPLLFKWKTVDLDFNDDHTRDDLVKQKKFIPENNLPLGLETHKNRLFLSLPQWKTGIPVTLTSVDLNSTEKSPKLRPYPSLKHQNTNLDPEACGKLVTSAFRMQVDDCDRLWVMDSGRIDIANTNQPLCPPTLFIFDLKTDELIKSYQIPKDQAKEDSLFTNLAVDVRPNQCNGGQAYMSDAWRFGVVVYDFINHTSFRVSHRYFLPDPVASTYKYKGLNFDWLDGIFGTALGPVTSNNDRMFHFHPLSSHNEFIMPVSAFYESSQSRAPKIQRFDVPRDNYDAQSTGMAIDSNGIMFFNMPFRGQMRCWNTKLSYTPANFEVIGSSDTGFGFLNELRLDREADQNIYVLSNNVPSYFADALDFDQYNYHVHKANVKSSTKGTLCDPNVIIRNHHNRVMDIFRHFMMNFRGHQY